MTGVSLIFTTSTHPLSRLIQWIGRSNASHCAIGGLSLAGVPLVLHASVGGVKAVPRAKYLAEHQLVAEYLVLACVDVQSAVEKLDSKYDYPGLLGFLPVMLGRWLGRKLRNPLSAPDAVVCSELVMALDPDQSRFPEWLDYDRETTTPGDLLADCALVTHHFKKISP